MTLQWMVNCRRDILNAAEACVGDVGAATLGCNVDIDAIIVRHYEAYMTDPKVAVELPGDITVHLTGADATEFMEQRGIQGAEPGSDVEDEPVAPAGG